MLVPNAIDVDRAVEEISSGLELPMMVRTQAWSDDEVKRLSAIIAAGGSPVRAAAALNRKIISCQNQARKMGTPFMQLSVRRRMIKEKCAAAERELARD
jgi:hypothetical protein